MTTPLYRIRFKANPDDYRPIKWPVGHPYWCSGFNEQYSTVISYADSEEYIKELWPEATDLDVEEVQEITFSSRFPRPIWFKDSHGFPIKVLP